MPALSADVDYARPRGAPAYLHPSSVHWRIFKNPVALAIGGVAAVLMEFADPRVRTGVWAHSDFAEDPIGRSERTGAVAMLGIYGPREVTRSVITRVNEMHAGVRGTTPDGHAYDALDPDLLDWVAATAQLGFVRAHATFVAPLTPADEERYWTEGKDLVALYGVVESPTSEADFMAMMNRRADTFVPHPIVTDFLQVITDGGLSPLLSRRTHRALARAAISILPPNLRDVLELGRGWNLTRRDRLRVRALATVVERIPDPRSAPCQASRRLGLPRTFLYRGARAQRRLLREAGLT